MAPPPGAPCLKEVDVLLSPGFALRSDPPTRPSQKIVILNAKHLHIRGSIPAAVASLRNALKQPRYNVDPVGSAGTNRRCAGGSTNGILSAEIRDALSKLQGGAIAPSRVPPRPVVDRGWAEVRATQPCFPKVTLAAAVPLSPESTTRTLFRGRRDLPFVEAAFDHGVGFAHQKVGRDLV